MGWRAFYSYSHKDAALRDRLSTHLSPLVAKGKLIEWYDRQIDPGANWDAEIVSQLESADLILLLISADFLASEYCFGVEVERALARLKHGEVKVVPILLRPCLWKESRFSELQIIPRGAKSVEDWTSLDGALVEVAQEISRIVSTPLPPRPAPHHEVEKFGSALELVRNQVRSYGRHYERIRQRMNASKQRTARMEQVFVKMRDLANASYPLLGELSASPSPGERLAAVAILQVFSAEQYLPFLVRLVGSEKPFVGYHAAKALQFAVQGLDPRSYPQLLAAIRDAQGLLTTAEVGFDTDRATLLRSAESELNATVQSLSINFEE